MKKSIKAALFSALVFPGAGHLFLKKKISGAILGCVSLAALYLIIANMLERAQQIVDKILRGEVSLDVIAITEQLSRQPVGNDSQLLDIAWAVLIFSWIIGIADSYRAGRAQDKSIVKSQ
jgi:hypothetical protein